MTPLLLIALWGCIPPFPEFAGRDETETETDADTDADTDTDTDADTDTSAAGETGLPTGTGGTGPTGP